MDRYKNIVLNIPHSSTNIPVNTWEGDIDKEIAKWTDWHTDKLFEPNSKAMIKPVVFPVSRFFCDFERLEDDPLENVGQGIFYTKFGDCSRSMDNKYLYDYVKKLYYTNKVFISSLIEADTMVIDCHSFPEELAPVTDICIGFNEDWSKPSDTFIGMVVNHFMDAGYNVDINCPYSNSITPKDSKDYSSFMIEVNKKNYLNPDNSINLKKYKKLNDCINYLYYNILYRL